MAINKVIRKRGPVYQVRVRDSFGRWYPVKSFRRRVDAEEEERKLFSLKTRGTLAESIGIRNRLSFCEYWEQWRQERRKNVSAGWQLSQDQMAKDYILPFLGDKKIGAVQPSDVGRIMLRLHDLGLASQTQLHVYNLLRKCFDDAVEYYELLDRSPVKLNVKIST